VLYIDTYIKRIGLHVAIIRLFHNFGALKPPLDMRLIGCEALKLLMYSNNIVD